MKRNVSKLCCFLATNGAPVRQLLNSRKHFMCQPAGNDAPSVADAAQQQEFAAAAMLSKEAKSEMLIL
jgi:threonine dehydratase